MEIPSIQASSDFPGWTRDSFGRIVFDTPTTLFTTTDQFTAQKETMDYVSTGTGTVFIDISNTIINLSVNGSGGRAVRQSREYLMYQPGKSQLFNFSLTPHYSGTFDGSVAIRAGAFDDYRDKNTPGSINPGTGVEVNQPSMGHFFELSGNKWFVVERANSPDNILNVTRIPQTDWNLDTLNGNPCTSPSGLLLPSDAKSGLLLGIERQWLGVGQVRMFIYVGGKPVFVHVFQNRLLNRPYTHLAKLPLRWEIEKVSGGISAPATLASICAGVHCLGTFSPLGVINSLPASLLPAAVSIDTTMRPLMGIRLQQGYCRATLKIKDVELIQTSGNNGQVAWSLIKNPVITGSPALTWLNNPDSTSLIQYVFVATPTNYTVSGGACARSAFLNIDTASQDSLSIDELLTARSICSDIAGNCDTIFLCAKQIGSQAPSILTNMRWLELTG